MTCSKNNPSMQQETNRQTSSTASSSKAKQPRITGPTSYEDLLAEDVRNDKRLRDEDDECTEEPSITLGTPKIQSIKVSSLGPLLYEKFRFCG